MTGICQTVYGIYGWLSEAFPPKPTWSVNDIPDLKGKVCIVTGANTGVGKETAKALLSHNAKVYLACRSREKAMRAIQDLERETGKEAIFMQVDLGDLGSVRKAGEWFVSQEKELHLLFNNAGVMSPPHDLLTTQGYDLVFGVNVLGSFYLTKLLLPIMLSTASSFLSSSPSSTEAPVRIINTASSAIYFADTIDFQTLLDGKKRRKMSETGLYAQSKLATILFSNELARRYGNEKIVSISLNPGNLDSELLRYQPKIVAAFARKFILYPPSMGALTQLWGGTSIEGGGFNGKYLKPWARVGTPNPAALDPKLGNELWEWCSEQINKFEAANVI